MNNEIKRQVGQRIRELRIISGLTQKEVSEKLGVVLQQYQTYESGRYELDYKKMIEICKIFDVSADYLLGLSEYM
ncbi:MAG: helix-turn-helix domain-containing protein [Bacteroides sp.]|nr:helix-turn-helix domain-containing protein [Bacillota bacterium]MCM1456155.1 helix-turn-helix domain-containing protein [Bacteroides sp.]